MKIIEELHKNDIIDSLIKTNPRITLLAVYGTLRKNCGNHGVLKCDESYFMKNIVRDIDIEYRIRVSSIHLGTFVTKEPFVMYHLGGFPGIVFPTEDNTGTPITVEVYATANENIIRSVDRLEGYRGEEHTDPDLPVPNFYNKVKIDTPWGNAWIYIYNTKDKFREIKTGDWLNQK